MAHSAVSAGAPAGSRSRLRPASWPEPRGPAFLQRAQGARLWLLGCSISVFALRAVDLNCLDLASLLDELARCPTRGCAEAPAISCPRSFRSRCLRPFGRRPACSRSAGSQESCQKRRFVASGAASPPRPGGGSRPRSRRSAVRSRRSMAGQRRLLADREDHRGADRVQWHRGLAKDAPGACQAGVSCGRRRGASYGLQFGHSPGSARSSGETTGRVSRCSQAGQPSISAR